MTRDEILTKALEEIVRRSSGGMIWALAREALEAAAKVPVETLADEATIVAVAEEWRKTAGYQLGYIAHVREILTALDTYRRQQREPKAAREEEAAGLRAAEAVEAIVGDLCDRRGLKREWAQIDSDVQAEIRVVWANLIVDAYRRQREGK